MKERPIIFNAEDVRAIIEGLKTQTRRVIPERMMCCRTPEDEPEIFVDWCKYGHVGDRLWVRETWANAADEHDAIFRADFDVADGFGSEVVDMETGKTAPLVWRPSIHMPRWASRITLEIVQVRVERLLEISRADCVQEGLEPTMRNDSEQDIRIRFFEYWHIATSPRDDGRSKYPALTNPWVWVIEFRRVT